MELNKITDKRKQLSACTEAAMDSLKEKVKLACLALDKAYSEISMRFFSPVKIQQLDGIYEGLTIMQMLLNRLRCCDLGTFIELNSYVDYCINRLPDSIRSQLPQEGELSS